MTEELGGVPVNEETVNNLRYRLNAMKDIMGDDNDPKALAQRKKAAKKRTAGNCLDTVIDGSFMGIVLAICLCTVLVTSFFAFKNLYYAVLKKVYPEAVPDEF